MQHDAKWGTGSRSAPRTAGSGQLATQGGGQLATQGGGQFATQGGGMV